MQQELLQPYLGGAGVSKEDYILELGQGHSFDGFEEQLRDDEESVSSEVPASAPT
jgi:FKBP-type peptidyl-prolyl cis-trans isomerase (trigger factor)